MAIGGYFFIYHSFSHSLIGSYSIREECKHRKEKTVKMYEKKQFNKAVWPTCSERNLLNLKRIPVTDYLVDVQLNVFITTCVSCCHFCILSNHLFNIGVFTIPVFVVNFGIVDTFHFHYLYSESIYFLLYVFSSYPFLIILNKLVRVVFIII